MDIWISFWTDSLKQTIWTHQNEGLPCARGVSLMHKLVWDCFYVELPAHASVSVCHSLQPLWTTWPRMWVSRLRGGWSWPIIRRCWDFCRWRQDRLTESNALRCTHTSFDQVELFTASAGTSVWEVSLWFSRQNSCHSIRRDLLVVILGLSRTSNSDKRTTQQPQARRRTARTHSEPFPKHTFTLLCIVVYESQCHYNR